jgi:hypothetical protein
MRLSAEVPQNAVLTDAARTTSRRNSTMSRHASCPSTKPSTSERELT